MDNKNIVIREDNDDHHIKHIMNYLSDNNLSIIESLGIISIVESELHLQRLD